MFSSLPCGPFVPRGWEVDYLLEGVLGRTKQPRLGSLLRDSLAREEELSSVEAASVGCWMLLLQATLPTEFLFCLFLFGGGSWNLNGI